MLLIEDINKCYYYINIIIQNKKFKLKYLINKTLERKTTKELVLQLLLVLSHNAIKIFVS